MSAGSEALLVGAVAAVGVLHTIVPDHWVPIALIARQRGWSRLETAQASLQAGIGHVVSTLLIALVVWVAGVAFAARFGYLVDTAASIALVGFGGWIALSAWRELQGQGGHGHSHSHGHSHAHGHDFPQFGHRDDIHGPELQLIDTDHGKLALSIYETGVPPRFRLTGTDADGVQIETLRSDGQRQVFVCILQGAYWESAEAIPEPHGFDVMVTVEHGGHLHRYETQFAEHDHGGHGHHHHDHDHDNDQDDATDPAKDALYAPLYADAALLTRHVHAHRHGRDAVHAHWHDHMPETAHADLMVSGSEPPLHEHKHKTSLRTALLIIMGSSPMVEGIPAFFAAGKYGIGLIIAMSIVFAASTIATYVLLCVYSTAGLQRIRLGAFERYGEVLSGAFIACVGMVFWI